MYILKKLRSYRLRDGLPRLSALEREALRAIVAKADVMETPAGPVLVAPVSREALEVLELVGSAWEDFEPDDDDEPQTDHNVSDLPHH